MLIAVDGLHSLVTPPVVEPLSVDEVRDHLRLTSTTEDGLLRWWIKAARQHVEEQTGRQLITATWDYWLNGTPDGDIELPHPPLQSVVSITYGEVGTSPEATVDANSYQVIAPQGDTCPRGRVSLLTGQSWPSVSVTAPNSLRIRYVAGYGSTRQSVPELLRVALLLLVGHFHQHRSEVSDASRGLTQLPFGAEAILRNFKYAALPTVPARRTA